MTDTVGVALSVNGRKVERTVPARTLLVDLLRTDLGLTGTHIGCDTSQCGACTVLLDGRSIKSCTMLAASAAGSEVTTVEGLAHGDVLHPVQDAFRIAHGLQCGFCTPGMVMASVALLSENPSPTEAEIRRGLEGNLCRCTGYQGIVDAVLLAAETMRARV